MTHLVWRRDIREKILNEYGLDEYVPVYVEYVPMPGQWYLDGEPISEGRAMEIITSRQG